MTEGEELYDVIAGIYEKHKDAPSVSPAWLATAAMSEIAFPRELHELGYIGCHLQFRQIARAFCRRNFDPTKAVLQDDLFPDTLQERYPVKTAKGEEAQYVLLDRLSDDDASYNINRMRHASLALQRHADALEAHCIARRERRA